MIDSYYKDLADIGKYNLIYTSQSRLKAIIS